MRTAGSSFSILVLGTAISLLGWLAVLSADHLDAPHRVAKQGLFLLLGMGAAIYLSLSDYRKLWRHAYALYGLALVFLGLVELGGDISGGAKRWFSMGPLSMQPSEPAKLALVVALARLMKDAHGNWEEPRHPLRLGVAGLALAAPLILLVTRQPDLGTAFVLIFVVMAMLFAGGGSLPLLLLTVVAGGAAAPYLVKDYQLQRIFTFFYPEADRLGVGYHLAQSRLAVSSGGLWGRGLFQGPLTQGHFVPENDTDFVFTVIGEEFGLVGCGGLLVLFTMLFFVTLWISTNSPDRFGAAVCLGTLTIFSFQFLVNVAMVLGLMPVVGLPLPFCSYGGSSTLASTFGLGLIASVANSRYCESRVQESYEGLPGWNSAL